MSAVPVVLKVGGGASLAHDAVAADVASWWKGGNRLVMVHGGAEFLNDISTKLGAPPEFLTSESGHVSRRTDRRTLEIFEMVYCGSMNKGWVERFQRLNVNAVGLSGLDGRIWEGPRKDAIRVVKNGRRLVVRDDYTGRVEKVNTALLLSLLESGLLPVLTPPAASTEGEAINVDGDRAAALTAAALGAHTLVILSDVPGLLERFPDEGVAHSTDPGRGDRGIHVGGGGTHEEEGSGRRRGAFDGRRAGDLRRRTGRTTAAARARGPRDGDR